MGVLFSALQKKRQRSSLLLGAKQLALRWTEAILSPKQQRRPLPSLLPFSFVYGFCTYWNNIWKDAEDSNPWPVLLSPRTGNSSCMYVYIQGESSVRAGKRRCGAENLGDSFLPREKNPHTPNDKSLIQIVPVMETKTAGFSWLVLYCTTSSTVCVVLSGLQVRLQVRVPTIAEKQNKKRN